MKQTETMEEKKHRASRAALGLLSPSFILSLTTEYYNTVCGNVCVHWRLPLEHWNAAASDGAGQPEYLGRSQTPATPATPRQHSLHLWPAVVSH